MEIHTELRKNAVVLINYSHQLSLPCCQLKKTLKNYLTLYNKCRFVFDINY